MSYVGNVPTTAAFPFDQFSGNGVTTAFTLSYAPAGSTSIIVSISGVVQNPNTYSVSGTTLTFTPAPPSGTNNIAVLYLGLPVVATLTPGNTAYFSSSVFTATASQTVFTPSGTYQAGFINVIRNGSQLAPADYTATNGTTVTLANPCTAGDVVVIEVYNLTSLTNALPLTGGTVTGATTFNSTLSVNGANVSGFTGFKNRIINGGMTIDQRNAGASVSASGSFVTDRFKFNYGGGGTFTGVQATDSLPTGFSYALKFTVGTADTSLAATDEYIFDTTIEGFNSADFLYGTASAQTTTISFWVRSSVTGTYAVAFKNSANTRTYPATYTINSANTWEYKTITVAGDTSGTWVGATNGLGLRLRFCLAAGSSLLGTANSWQAGDLDGATGQANWMATSGNTFYITGVQLERGSNATSFEFRSITQELAMCQRYYINFNDTYPGALLGSGSMAAFRYILPLPVTMRAAPTVTFSNVTAGFSAANIGGGGQERRIVVEITASARTDFRPQVDTRAEIEL